jgi:hypothetical protein
MQRVMFCTAWQVDCFLLNAGADIRVGPFGENEVSLRFYNANSQDIGVSISKTGTDEIFAKCVVQIPKSAADALAAVHDSLTPVRDESLISSVTPSAELRDQFQLDRQKAPAAVAEILTKPPASLRDVRDKVSKITQDAAIHLLRLLRWRAVRDFHFQVSWRTGIYWTSPLDGHWRRVPSVPDQPSGLGRLSQGISAWPGFVEEINQMLSNDIEPAISFDLLCEARHLSSSRPHLALIEAVQALEIGTKEAITRLSPADGLELQNTQSPPVIDLLVDHTPKLISSAVVKELYLTFFTKQKQKDLKKIVYQRNELIHRAGKIKITAKSAEFACDLVGDCLYKLELACGQSWAANAVWNR